MVLLAALALVLSACGGDSSDVEPQAADTTEQESETAPSGSEATEAEEPDEGEDFQVEGPSEPVRVVYEGNVEGFDRLVVSVDPPRSVMLFDDGRFIDDGEGHTIFCAEEQGGEPFCMELESEQAGAMTGALFGSLLGVQEALEAGELGGTTTSTTEIAGREAICIEPTELMLGQTAESAELCVDAELGIWLRWRVVDSTGEQLIEAVEVGEPDPAEFEPPAEPQQMPSG